MARNNRSLPGVVSCVAGQPCTRFAESRSVSIGLLIAGLISGALARLIKPGRQNLSVLATLGLGLVGSLIGGLIAQLIGTGGIVELNILGFVLAALIAVIVSTVHKNRRSVRSHR